MSLTLNQSEIAKRCSGIGITVLMMTLAVFLMPSAAGQDVAVEKDLANENCGPLHAGIRAELVKPDSPDTQPPFVMLTFVLLNDGDTPINSTEQGWTINIDGKELKDSVWIFGNGPGPVGGYGILQPGESYAFGKGLPLSKYFPEEREYRVYWKGRSFKSSTITVKITPAE